MGALIGGGIGALHDFVPEFRTALRVLGIIGGIGMMLSGDPSLIIAGFLFTASGGLSFCQDTGCQMGSALLGIAGGAALLGSGPGGGSRGGGIFGRGSEAGSDFGGSFSPALGSAGVDFPITRVGFFNSRVLAALITAWMLSQGFMPPGPDTPADIPVEQPEPFKPPTPSGDSIPGTPPPQPQRPPPQQSPQPRVPWWGPYIPKHPYPFFILPPCSNNPAACRLNPTPQPI